MNIRPIKNHELPFLKEMLYEALFVPEGATPFPKSILEKPEISKYIHDWGRVGDLAMVCEKEGSLVGAVWLRQFTYPKIGYGYVDDETPELTMAVVKGYRNRGFGTRMLEEIWKIAIPKLANAISLSVDKRNPAIHLYRRFEFTIIKEEETAFTMIKRNNYGHTLR